MGHLILRRRSIAWRACLLAGAAAWAARDAAAVTLFFTNEADWVAATTNREIFQTTAANVGLADEVDAPAANNADVGSNLTFQAVNTGLSWSFRAATVEADARFTFNDNEVGPTSPPYPGYEDALSVGDIDDSTNDDVQVVILDGPALHGFALEIGDNEPGYPDGGIFVYGPADEPLGSFPALPSLTAAFSFLGVVSDESIRRVMIDADAGGDDMSIRHFRFARHHAVDPAVTALSPAPGGRMKVEWPSASEWRYDVETVSDLAGEFTPLATNLPATPPLNSHTNVLGPARAFYRVRARVEP